MLVCVLEVQYHFPWAKSLKEKRLEVKNIIAKLQNKFNVSVIESGRQEEHQYTEIGLVYIVHDKRQADSYMENILAYAEVLSEGEMTVIATDFI